MSAESRGVHGAFRRVAVLGLGVMGGSLARALARLPAPPERVGWSPRSDEAGAALDDGALTRVAATVDDAVGGADLVVLATPLEACVDLVPAVLAALAQGAVLTDVASLKAPVEAAVLGAGGGARWVGSHPLCGSASSGFAASRADLYRGARVYLVTPPDAAWATPRLASFWAALGGHPVPTTSALHDALMVLASHLPQLTSNALALALADAGLDAGDLGPGGRGATRLAASSPGMWRDILHHAPRPPLTAGLRAVASRLEAMAAALEGDDLEAVVAFMESTRRWKGEGEA